MSEDKILYDSTKNSLVAKLVSGAVAGIIGTSIIFPIDLVKTRLQNNSEVKLRNLISGIWKHEGVRGFYKGLMANLIGVTPEKAIKLAVNDHMRYYLCTKIKGGNPETLPAGLGMLAGAVAGLAQVTATNPMEAVKIQMQISSGDSRPSTIAIVRNLGIRGLYRGSLATLSRDIPFSIIFFQSFASLKSYFAGRNNGNGQVSFVKVFLSGILAGSIGAFLVTPMDVVKTRIQSSPPEKRIQLLQVYKEVYRNEGISAFFRGSLQRCLIVSPLFGISLVLYEAQKAMFNQYSREK